MSEIFGENPPFYLKLFYVEADLPDVGGGSDLGVPVLQDHVGVHLIHLSRGRAFISVCSP